MPAAVPADGRRRTRGRETSRGAHLIDRIDAVRAAAFAHIEGVVPKFSSVFTLVQTFAEQLLLAQKALPADAFNVDVVPVPEALYGSASALPRGSRSQCNDLVRCSNFSVQSIPSTPSHDHVNRVKVS